VTPVVSVVIPAYNAREFLRDALRSLGEQTVTDFEAIVVDDGSTDETRTVAEAAARGDARFRVVGTAGPRGPGVARNRGLEVARGEWVTFLDADDWYAPDRLAALLSAARGTSHTLLGDNQWFIDRGCGRPWRRLVEGGEAGEMLVSVESFLAANPVGFGIRPGLGLVKPFVRRKLLEEHGLRYHERPTFQEDFLFLLGCLARSGSLLLLRSATYYYRQHGGSRLRTLTPADFTAVLRLGELSLALFPRPEDAPIRAALEARARRVRQHVERRMALREMGVRAMLVDPGLTGEVLGGVWATAAAAARRCWARAPVRRARGV